MNENKEEKDIDDLNKAVSSTYMDVFKRSCTILGYSVYLSLAICTVLSFVSIPNAANDQYENGLPKVSNWLEYFLYFGGTMVCAAGGWSFGNYTDWCVGLGATGFLF